MAVEIQYSQSYLWLNSWVLANVVQLATQSFCDRFVNYQIDPCHRLYDQMVMAARSVVANIAEGSARRNTSRETEMRLTDVARASLDELQGDFFNYLLRRRAEVWKVGDANREAIWHISLERPNYGESLLHDAAKHILRQMDKYAPWTESDDSLMVSNSLLVMIHKLNKMLQRQMEQQFVEFKQEGGFSENMTKARMETRGQQTQGPACPLCGKPMLRRFIKRGAKQGQQFWGCSDYPRCNGARNIQDSP